MKPFFLLTIVLMLLGGCGQLPLLGGQDEAKEVADMLAYGQRTAQSPAEEQRRELALANQAFARERTPRARLRLALLLAQPGSAVNDDARAAGLLEPFATSAAAPGGTGAGAVQQLGSLLQAQVAERVREQRRAQQMKEQIDALRALERNLIDRGQSKPR